MNKIYGMLIAMLVLSTSFVSANLCNDAVAEYDFYSHPELFDVNGDGVVNLSDLGLFAGLSQNDSWCEEQYSHLFEVEEPVDTVSRGQSFSHYNLDRRSIVEMSRNIPFMWLESISREIQFEGERYRVGFNGNHVNFYHKETMEKTNLDIEVEVKYRTFWSRTLVFSKG